MALRRYGSGSCGGATIPVPDSFPVATDARLGGDDTQTRFVMDLDRKIDLHAFTLADPYRVVVDLPQVTFQLPPKAGESGRGLIKAFRFGLVMPGGSRLVFDLAKPARVDKAFVIDAARWRAGAARARPRRHRPRELPAPDRAGEPHQPPRTAARQPGRDRRRRSAAAGRARSRPRRHRHRHRAPERRLEKDIVLGLGAKRLRDRIEKSGKYRVLMTRADDTFVPLADRVHIARNAGAALFVSIHADRCRAGRAMRRARASIRCRKPPPIRKPARLAEKENRADVIAGVDLKAEPDDVAGILIDLAERETKSLFAAVCPQTGRRNEDR